MAINLENHLKADIKRLQTENVMLVARLEASGVQSLENENVDLKAQVAKADDRILKFKERLHKFMK